MAREIIVDTWSALDYKKAFFESRGPGFVPTWVGAAHLRRLRAYTLLAMYLNNTAREWLDSDDESKRQDRREYGDSELIVQTIVAAILGNDPSIDVEGADETDAPEPPPEGAPAPPPGGTGLPGRPVNAAARALQDWFDTWADDERPLLSFIEGEEDSVGLGDALYTVTWDSTKERPVITVYDPGFYFPPLDQGQPRDFPLKIHVAWEFERWNTVTRTNDRMVRRITWELKVLDAPKQYPWNASPTNTACFMSDGTWHLKGLGQEQLSVDDLDDDNAEWEVNADGIEVRDLDIGVDFIPVVHVPNTANRKEHFGKSSLMQVLQILDEIQSADTDLALSARTTGFPPLSVEGALETLDDGKTVKTYGPGTVFQGKASVVDTSKSLDALMAYIEFLLKRLSTNSRLPESLLGRVKPSEVPSGFAMALSFGPLTSMVTKMRMIRDEKYPLLLKFVARWAMLAGQIPASSDIPKVTLRFGRYLPNDRASVIADVTKLFTGHLISRLAAVETLVQEAGLSLEDAEAEVTRIEHEDFAGAKALADALGAEDPAYEYLGRTLPATTTPRVDPNLPPAPVNLPRPGGAA